VTGKNPNESQDIETLADNIIEMPTLNNLTEIIE
jgi:hypothetical protein